MAQTGWIPLSEVRCPQCKEPGEIAVAALVTDKGEMLDVMPGTDCHCGYCGAVWTPDSVRYVFVSSSEQQIQVFMADKGE